MPGCKVGDQAIIIQAIKDRSKLGQFVKVLAIGEQGLFGQVVVSCKIRFGQPMYWGIWDRRQRTYLPGTKLSQEGWFPDSHLQPIRGLPRRKTTTKKAKEHA